MAEIIKTYTQRIPAVRFIGIKYGDEDRVDGVFSVKWGEWFQNERFGAVEKGVGDVVNTFYEDAGAYIGLMRFKEGEPFEYWIGMFAPENSPVPDGYGSVDFPASTMGVCWVYGRETDVYFQEEKCGEKLLEAGYEIAATDGAVWFLERYACPRFTTPDDKGNIILDICHYIK